MKILRSLFIIFLMILAAFGMPFGNLFGERHRYADKRVTIEVLKREDETNEESNENDSEKT